MPVDEMPDELILKTYRIALLQLEIEELQLQVIKQYGCLHDGSEPDACLKQHTMQKKMALDTIAVFWNVKKGLLKANGYERIAG